MEKIQAINLKKQYKRIRPQVMKNLLKVISSQKFILGEETKKFERAFSKFCKKKYAIGLSSGTDALYIALSIMGFQGGDEVIVPVFTFIAAAEAVSLLGGKIVFCDVNSSTGLIDINDLKKRISKATKYIIPVHLYGQLAPMQEIKNVIGKRNIQIIEDAAQAHGAKYKNKMSPITKIATYSFFPSKNLGAYGDAGAIVTNNKRLYEKVLQMRNHGQMTGRKYYHRSIGFNFRMDEIQAAVLNVKLKYLNSWLKRRHSLAKVYEHHLQPIHQVEIVSTLPFNYHAYHLFCIKTKHRDSLKKYLEKNGVEPRVHYPLPLHLQPAYRHLAYKRGEFPAAEDLANKILCLPIYPELRKKHIIYITDKIRLYFGR